MSSTLPEIRDGIKKTLAMIELNVYDTIPSVTNVPAVVVVPWRTEYGTAMAMGGDKYEFNLGVLVQSVDPREAQEQLDAYINGKGEKSIREHIFHNCTLGLPDVDANCEGLLKDSYGGNYESAGNKYLGALLRLCVIVT